MNKIKAAKLAYDIYRLVAEGNAIHPSSTYNYERRQYCYMSAINKCMFLIDELKDQLKGEQ